MLHLLIKQKTEYLRKSQALTKNIKELSYALLDIRPGQKILEIGCGLGTDTISLAKIVGCTGNVVGVDADASMIQQANEAAQKARVSSWTTHLQADGFSLPFGDNSFDVCRCERVFIHLNNPDNMLAEIIRVTKSGGSVGIMEPDWGTLSIDSSMPDVERRLVKLKAESFVNGYAGKRLYGQMKKQNLAPIQIEIFPIAMTSYSLACYIANWIDLEKSAVAQNILTAREVEYFDLEMEQKDKDGIFFGSLSMIMAIGKKT
jgi:ubiquinone/menaquinone biosynthesis C-methylase UbiE